MEKNSLQKKKNIFRFSKKFLFIEWFLYLWMLTVSFLQIFLITLNCFHVLVFHFILAKWQNPKECDAMTKIQNDLDETKIILVSFFFFFLSLLFHCFKYEKEKNVSSSEFKLLTVSSAEW